MRRIPLASFASAVVLSMSCAAPLGVSEAPIVAGTLAPEYPQIYYMYNAQLGNACTATLITPRVVLLARHCIANAAGISPASDITFRVGINGIMPSRIYATASIHVIPGSRHAWGEGANATDVALAVLTTDAGETPIPIARTSPAALLGRTITAVGFGEIPTGDQDFRLRMSSVVDRIGDGIVFLPPTVCHGDSGGPLLADDGHIYGVASYMFRVSGAPAGCGSERGAYNEIFRHLAWIDSVVATTIPPCVPSAEVCNGRDDDCNGGIDEPCVAAGLACTSTSICLGGTACSVTALGRRCASACDALRPTVGCSSGFYCGAAIGSCDGFCLPGTPGGTPIDMACSSDVDCASGLCRDERCAEPCRAGGSECAAGRMCGATVARTCGACGLAGDPRRGLGEACMSSTECRSELCSGGVCVMPCPAGGCAVGYSCRAGSCVVDVERPDLSPCLDASECASRNCASGICAPAVGEPDGGGLDAGPVARFDAGRFDGGRVDVGRVDAGRLDASGGDTGGSSSLRGEVGGCGCSAAHARRLPTWLAMLALLCLGQRARRRATTR